MEYYVFGPDGERFGPADVDLLNRWAKQGRVDNDTLVQAVGSESKIPITMVEGFIAGPPVTAPSYGQGQTYVGGPRQNGAVIESHLTKALVSTLCCCLPLGVVSVVYAVQVDGHVRRGDIESAKKASESANGWANLSIGAAIVLIAIRILLAFGSRQPDMRNFDIDGPNSGFPPGYESR